VGIVKGVKFATKWLPNDWATFCDRQTKRNNG